MSETRRPIISERLVYKLAGGTVILGFSFIGVAAVGHLLMLAVSFDLGTMDFAPLMVLTDVILLIISFGLILFGISLLDKK